MKTLGILGCGEMARALILRMHQKKIPLDYYCYTPTNIKAKNLSQEINGTHVLKIEDFIQMDYFLLACKPHQIKDLSLKFRKVFPAYKGTLISILAGVSTSKIEELFFTKNIIRVMPNTPAFVGKGVCALFGHKELPLNIIEEVKSFFTSGSRVFEFKEEDQIDLITPFSGSGPAYLFEFARIMEKELTKLGIDEKISTDMIAQTFLGAGALLSESHTSFEVLRDNVTSRNGVTEAALNSFKKEGLEELVKNALKSALNRTFELKG